MPVQGHFCCATCGVQFSRHVFALDDRALLRSEDGQPLLPPGTFVELIGDDFFTQLAHCTAINLEDAVETERILRRCQGCCGVDGLDGLNATCPNGHEVGTEKSDCWMPHCMLFEPSLVRFVPIST